MLSPTVVIYISLRERPLIVCNVLNICACFSQDGKMFSHFTSIICTKFFPKVSYYEHYVICSQILCPCMILLAQPMLNSFIYFTLSKNCDHINNQNCTLGYLSQLSKNCDHINNQNCTLGYLSQFAGHGWVFHSGLPEIYILCEQVLY